MPLSPEDLLATTRCVRRRLDFERPVQRAVIEPCVELALQAPSGGNRQSWSFLLIDEPETKQRIAEYYRAFFSVYRTSLDEAFPPSDPRRVGPGMIRSGEYLAENLERAPWLVIPCIEGLAGRIDEGTGPFLQAMTWGSIYPAVWSLMLALRSRGLSSCLTTNHLAYEREVAELLGIPFERVNQAGLLPVAHTLGSGFRRAPRRSVEEVVHLNRW